MKKTFNLLTAFAVIIILATGCRKGEELIQKQETVSSVQNKIADTSAIETPTLGLKECPILEDAGKISGIHKNTASTVITLYIDTDGENNVDGGPWGISGTFNCPKPSNSQLPSAQKVNILNMVKEDFSPFTVNVVTTLAEFQQAPYPKMQIILTNKTSQILQSPILGAVPGASYVSSIFWGDGTPCFVFINEFTGSDKYKKIAESVTHELGHTFGLYHQSEPNGGYEYRWPSEDLLYGALMGNAYQVTFSRWIDGLSAYLGWQTQYDARVIASVAGWKDEPYTDVLKNSTPVVAGTLITTTLVHAENWHAFYKNTAGTKTLTVKSKGNIKPIVYLYNSPTDSNPVIVYSSNTGDITTSITGKKFIRVGFEQPAGYAISEAGGSYTIKCN